MIKDNFNIKIISVIIGAVFIAMFSWNYYELKRFESKLSLAESFFTNKADELDKKVALLSDNLSVENQNLENARSKIQSVQSQVGGVQETVGKIGGTVNTLDKLSRTDPELLQKYSKVFFLNEHYAPERLSEIDKTYLYSDKKSELIHSLVLPHLMDMLEAAKAQGVDLYIKSAYRSFEEQKSVKSAYTVIYGKGSANQFSADQGYSEHQLGTTADFTTIGVDGSLSGFEKTLAYLWMQLNAYKYGFILSYPINNGYYIFEPWHWRFVGAALATRLKAESKNFYDLDQREIDKYLANIFD